LELTAERSLTKRSRWGIRPQSDAGEENPGPQRLRIEIAADMNDSVRPAVNRFFQERSKSPINQHVHRLQDIALILAG